MAFDPTGARVSTRGASPTESTKVVDVVIIGAGIAGLATAYELNRRGGSFVLVEAGARAGGVVLSEELDGYTIDAGPDSLLVQKPDAIKLCEELGLGERLIATKPPRVAFVQRAGALHPLPAGSVLGIPTRIGPYLRTKLFSWPGKIRMGAELFVPPRRDDADESIGAFMTRRFGVEAATYLAEPLLAGIHAGDVDRLSIGALFPRFTHAERTYGSLIRAFRKQPRGTVSVDGAFRSMPGGLSDLVRALVAALPAEAICYRTPIRRVHREPQIETAGAPMFRVETTSGDFMLTRAVVLATPTYITSRLVRTVDEDLSALCDEVRYTSTATIVMAFERAAVSNPLNGSGFVVPRVENGRMLAVSWLSSKWPDRAPAGRVLLRSFAGGARDPQALQRTDNELAKESLDALRPLLGVTGDPLFTRVYRWERASAQHEVGHLKRLEAIERLLARHPGLFVTGSGFRGVGIPDCVADGCATARQAADWLQTGTASAL